MGFKDINFHQLLKNAKIHQDIARLQRPVTARVLGDIKRYGQVSKDKIPELTEFKQLKFELTPQGKNLSDIKKG